MNPRVRSAIAHFQSAPERGSGLVEFALILPVFMMLVLGMFTGGIAYSQKNTMTNAVREASRYGATLSVNGDMAAWLRAVAVDARDNATGDLGDGVTGRRVCVAYVYPNGDLASPVNANDRTVHVAIGAGAIPATVTVDPGRCTLANGATYDDGITDGGQRRVNVVVSRTSELQALLFTMPLSLQAKSATRFEAVAS